MAANLAVAIACVHFFFLPYGSTFPDDDGEFLLVFGMSVLAISVGSALSLWGMGSQRQRGGSITLDLVGLVLNWLPYPLMLFLVHEAVTLQRFWDGG